MVKLVPSTVDLGGEPNFCQISLIPLGSLSSQGLWRVIPHHVKFV